MLHMCGHVSIGFFSLWRPILARWTQSFLSYCWKCAKWIFWI